MGWTTPPTWADGNALAAAELNTYLRDNLNETMPAKVAGPLQFCVAVGTNQIAARQISIASVDEFEATSSTTFTGLATVGPSLTVETGTQALVIFTYQVFNTFTGDRTSATLVSISVSGATTISSADANACRLMFGASDSTDEETVVTGSMANLPSLNAGSNTFTMKYRNTNAFATVTFGKRQLIVVPL